ncbi:MAG: SpaH/EbpB family LPXTG-anchored major pilin [Lachnospiraceae bacterium]
MQLLKNFSAFLITTLLLISLTAPALAAEPVGTITMKNSAGAIKTDSTYEAYRIVGWNASTVEGNVLYTDMALTPAYKEAIILALGNPLTVTSTDQEVLKALSTVKDSSKLAGLAVALSEVKGQLPLNATAGIFRNLSYGYYLVMETKNNANDGTVLSKPILVSLPDKTTNSPDVSVMVKTSTANVDKEIVLGNHTVKAAEKKIGDTVDFKLTATIPTYATNATGITYCLTDTLSKGLTLNDKSIVVKDSKGAIIADKNNYTVGIDRTAANKNTVLTINFTYDNIKTLGPLTVEYSAILNENSVIGSSGNPNSVNLTYTNNPGAGSNYTTTEKHTLIYTTGLELLKVGSNSQKLAGAEFGIYSNKECSIPVGFYTYELVTDGNGTHVTTKLIDGKGLKIVTGDDGIAYFTGLIAGKYYIKEIKAPIGYDLLKTPICVTIGVTLPQTIENGREQAAWTIVADYGSFDNRGGIFYGNVVNTKGFQLPGSGGSGTILFTVGGLSLLTLAGALYFLYHKKKRV